MAELFTVLSLIISSVIPVILLIYARRKLKVSYKTIAIGALVWIVFSQVLEKGLHAIVITQTPIIQFPIVSALYGALAAALFEESGRYFAFIKWLKGKREWQDGFGYGIGHGGIESILIGLVGGLQTLLLLRSYKDGTLNQLPGLSPEIYNQIIVSLNLPPVVFLISGIERVMALIIQIALSILVLYAVKSKKKKYFFYAIAAHFIVDLAPALYQVQLISLLTAEVIILAFALTGYIFIKKSKGLLS